jgi:hypothetical protein
MHTWYLDNFPADINLVDCRNCSQHMPPTTSQENCVFCDLLGHNVDVTHAEECVSFPTFAFVKTHKNNESTCDYPSLTNFFPEIEAPIKIEEKKETTWVPQSNLDSKVFGFNDSNIAAALRAMFDILEGISKRLDKIEEKMPSTKIWRMKSFLKKRYEVLGRKKRSYTFKKKTKKKEESLAALFGKKEEKSAEKTT